jgi:phage repressor protein C with HTH and peptisase S24 domain
MRKPARSKQRPNHAAPGADRVAFAERLKLIVTHWPSADKLARAAGVSTSAFRKWLRGDAEPSRGRLVALADVSGVSLAWLAKGEGPLPTPGELGEWTGTRSGPLPDAGNFPHGFLILPDVPEGAAAGSGNHAPASNTKFVAFRIDWLRQMLAAEPSKLILETALGDSMEPMIHDGDLLLIDTGETGIRDFGVFVIEVRNERLVKRVQRKFDGALILISDNSLYQPEEIAAGLAGEIKVVGKVVWRGGRI